MAWQLRVRQGQGARSRPRPPNPSPPPPCRTDASEAVLDGAQQAQLAPAVALQVHHRVDEVLQRLGARDLAALGDWGVRMGRRGGGGEGEGSKGACRFRGEKHGEAGLAWLQANTAWSKPRAPRAPPRSHRGRPGTPRCQAPWRRPPAPSRTRAPAGGRARQVRGGEQAERGHHWVEAQAIPCNSPPPPRTRAPEACCPRGPRRRRAPSSGLSRRS
jgi:hypothetical protein